VLDPKQNLPPAGSVGREQAGSVISCRGWAVLRVPGVAERHDVFCLRSSTLTCVSNLRVCQIAVGWLGTAWQRSARQRCQRACSWLQEMFERGAEG